MPLDARSLCQDSLQDLIQRGLLKSYENSGKFIKPRVRHSVIPLELGLIAHYSVAEGPLYEDESQWEFATDWCTASPTGPAQCAADFPARSLWAVFRACKVDDLMSQLPHVFEQCGFVVIRRVGLLAARFSYRPARAKSNNCRSLTANGSKFQQRNPRWDRPVELEMEAVCNLSAPTKYVTRMDSPSQPWRCHCWNCWPKKLGQLLGAAIPRPSLRMCWEKLAAPKDRISGRPHLMPGMTRG